MLIFFPGSSARALGEREEDPIVRRVFLFLKGLKLGVSQRLWAWGTQVTFGVFNFNRSCFGLLWQTSWVPEGVF